MARWVRWAKRPLAVLLLLALFSGSVVAAETYREYHSWSDRPLGVLELLFGFRNAELPAAPTWPCNYGYEPPSAPLDVTLFWDGDARHARLGGLRWEAELEHRLPIPLHVAWGGEMADIDDAYAHAERNRQAIVVVLTDHHFRGSGLNERLEGFACANIAVVNAEVDCAESIVAHEVGHVLGLRHTPTGLMRSRAVTCDARADPETVGPLLARLTPAE